MRRIKVTNFAEGCEVRKQEWETPVEQFKT